MNRNICCISASVMKINCPDSFYSFYMLQKLLQRDLLEIKDLKKKYMKSLKFEYPRKERHAKSFEVPSIIFGVLLDTKYVSPGVDFINICARHLRRTSIREKFVAFCGELHLANGAQIWRISAHKFGEQCTVCVDEIERRIFR